MCRLQPPLYESADQAHKSKEPGNEHYGRHQFSGRGLVLFVLSVLLHVDHLVSRDHELAIEMLQLNYSPMKVFLRFQLLRLTAGEPLRSGRYSRKRLPRRQAR